MGVPADADWAPPSRVNGIRLGMRGTDSRTLVLDEAVVPEGNEWLPPGAFDQAATRWPYFYMTLSFAYLGLMRGVLDATAAYLRGDGGGGPARRDHPIKQQGWAQMNLTCTTGPSRSHTGCWASAASIPGAEQVRRAWSSVVTVMEGAPAMASAGPPGVRRAAACCGRHTWSRPTATPAAGPRCFPGAWRCASSASAAPASTPNRTKHRPDQSTPDRPTGVTPAAVRGTFRGRTFTVFATTRGACHDRLGSSPRPLARPPRSGPRQVPARPVWPIKGTSHCVCVFTLGYDRSMVPAPGGIPPRRTARHPGLLRHRRHTSRAGTTMPPAWSSATCRCTASLCRCLPGRRCAGRWPTGRPSATAPRSASSSRPTCSAAAWRPPGPTTRRGRWSTAPVSPARTPPA